MSNKNCDGGCWAHRALLLAPRRSGSTKLAQFPKSCIDSIDYKRLKYGGGGGSRTRVRNRCQPGEFMLCPLPFGFAPGTQNGQDAPRTSPMILRKQHGPSCSRQPTV